MGRVARYKKIRKCDPAMAGIMKNGWGEGDSGRKAKKRSKTAEKHYAKKMHRSEEEGFDMAPTDTGDDFDMSDLVGSLKKQKPVVISLKTVEKKSLVNIPAGTNSEAPDTVAKPDTAGTPAGALSLSQEKRDAKILNIDPEKEKKREATIVAPRMTGESRNAFQKRMKMETKKAIRNERTQDNRNPEKKQRKKDFMNAKKKNKKNKGGNTTNDTWDDDFGDSRRPKGDDRDIDILVTGERATQQVAFGEQVERPPTFQVLPRGCTAKRKMSAKSSSNGMSDEQRRAEHNSMEKMRLKVQAQYAIMKAKRRQAGEFHL